MSLNAVASGLSPAASASFSAAALLADHSACPGSFIVSLYLSSLNTPQSRASMAASLRAVALLVARSSGSVELGIPLGEVEGDRLDWARLDYPAAVQVRALMGERWAAGTVNRHLAAIRGVVRVCRLTGLMEARVAEAVGEALRPAKREHDGPDPSSRLVSDVELHAVFAALAADPHPSARRDAALVAVLAMGGIRRSEAAGLDLADWDEASGALVVRKGKGGKRRKVWLHSGAAQALDDWLDKRGSGPGPLFVQVYRSGRIPFAHADIHDPTFDPEAFRVSSHALWTRVKHVAEAGGIAEFAPHDLRRKVATDLLDDGVDISAVRSLLGHTSIATTAIYDRRGERAARSAAARITLPYIPPRQPAG